MRQPFKNNKKLIPTILNESLPTMITIAPSQLLDVENLNEITQAQSSQVNETMPLLTPTYNLASQAHNHINKLGIRSNLRNSYLGHYSISPSSLPTETMLSPHSPATELSHQVQGVAEYVQASSSYPSPDKPSPLSTSRSKRNTAEFRLKNFDGSRPDSRCSFHSKTSGLDSRILVYDGVTTHNPWDISELISTWLPSQEVIFPPSNFDTPARSSQASSGRSTPRSSHSFEKSSSVAWIYLFNPSPSEVQLIGEVLQLHHLTIEDIIMQETRDKCDIFPGYNLISYGINEFEPAFNRKEVSFDNKQPSGFFDLLRFFSRSRYDYVELNSNTSLPENLTNDFTCQPDLGEEYGRFRVRSLFNVITENRVITFHYGNVGLESQLLPSIKSRHKLNPEEINSLVLHRLTEIMDHQLRSLEQEILEIDDFYLIGESGDGQPHYHGTRVNASLIPVRLDQLRQAVQLWDEALSSKPAMFRSYASSLNRRISVIKKAEIDQLDIQLSSSLLANPLHAWKRRNRGLTPAPSPRGFTPRSSSPSLTPKSPSAFHHTHSESFLPGLDLDRGNSLISQLLNIEGHIAAMRIAVAHSHLMIERSFGLQRCNSELSLTYRSIYQSNSMAEFSGWAWVAVPLTFMSTLIGVNVMVPGQVGRFDGPWFTSYILFMLGIGLLFYLVARWGGILS